MDREKFKEMSFGKKVEWLVQYYGVATIAIIVAVLVCIYLIKSIFMPADYEDLCVLIYSDEISAEDADMLCNSLQEKTGKTIAVLRYGESDAYGSQSFALKLSDTVLDIVIAPDEETEKLVQSGFFAEYKKIEGKNLNLGISGRARRGELLDEVVKELSVYLERDMKEVSDD